MIIHVVAPNQTVYSIAEIYGVTPQSILDNNEIRADQNLVVGQTLVILLPERVHVVREGETLDSIAEIYNTSAIELLRNNPIVSEQGYIYPGEVLTISFDQEKVGNISINGYIYPNVDRKVLMKTLPYLTYITIFTYGFTPQGELIGVDDEEIIAYAKEFGVQPVMVISTLGEDGSFSNELASAILNNEEAQNKLIDEIIANMTAKGYSVLEVDFEYILPQDGDEYVRFINKLNTRMEPYGIQVWVALAPKTFAEQPGLLYESHRYGELGNAADAVLIMAYEWGYTYGPPMAVAPINKVRQVIDYAVSEIEPGKINMGMPNYGYNWMLPFVQGVSKADSLSNVQAVELAAEVGATIEFDDTAMAPFFRYFDGAGIEHEVWFEDARSVKAKLDLITEYGLNGGAYWNLMRYFPQSWLVINALYNIEKQG